MMLGSDIILAASQNDINAVKKCISRTITNYISQSDLNEALRSASTNGHQECVQILLDSGADVNSTDNDGATPLILAVKNNHEPVIRCLLNEKGEINHCNLNSHSALHIACQNGNVTLIELLLDNGADIAQEDDYGNTAILIASQNGHAEAIRVLVRYGAEINCKNCDGLTVLHCASKMGFLEVAKEALSAGASLDMQELFGCTPLHMACKGGHEEVVNLLIDAGADIMLGNNGKFSPLHEAVRYYNFNCVKVLLDKIQDPRLLDIKDIHGITPLYYAVENYNPAKNCAKLLLQAGASCHAHTKPRNPIHKVKLSLLDLAVTRNQMDLVEMLLITGQFSYKQIQKSIEQAGSQDVVQWLRRKMETPLNLSQLCRLAVRNNMLLTERNISSLQLPDRIKKYLLFFDL